MCGGGKGQDFSYDQIFFFVYTKCNVLFVDDFAFGHLLAQMINRLNLSSRF
jgi:hypothetical protein